MKNNLKLYRTKSGYTQEDISKKLVFLDKQSIPLKIIDFIPPYYCV